MSRTGEIIDQLARIQDGDPWYGDSIARVLEGLTHEEAAAHPIGGAHSIWELVLHLRSWIDEVARRLDTGVAQEPPAGDWPEVPAPTAAHWRATQAALAQAHADLRERLRGLPEGQLDKIVGDVRNPALGTGVTYLVMLHGLLQHDTYHLGQIGLLRKALRQR